MTTIKLRNTVAEAVSLDRQIHDLQSRLDDLEAKLVAEATTHDEEHVPTEGGGWSWTAEGADGCIVRVTKSGPALKSTITTDKDIAKAKDLCGPQFLSVFEPKIAYKLGAQFRATAERILGEKTAAKLVKLFSGSGRTTVNYETKEAA